MVKYEHMMISEGLTIFWFSLFFDLLICSFLGTLCSLFCGNSVAKQHVISYHFLMWHAKQGMGLDLNFFQL